MAYMIRWDILSKILLFDSNKLTER
jgi:hypothetical protein